MFWVRYGYNEALGSKKSTSELSELLANSSDSSEEAVPQTDLDLFTFPAVCFIYSFQHGLVEKDSEKQRRTNFVFSIDSLRRLVLNSKHVKSGGDFFLREYFSMPVFLFVFL